MQDKFSQKDSPSTDKVENYKLKVLSKRNYEPYVCEECGNTFTKDYRNNLETIRKEDPRFCCKSCAAKFSQKHTNKLSKKLVECNICHENVLASAFASPKNFICENCRSIINQEKKRNKENKILGIPYRYPPDTIFGRFERSLAYKMKSKNLEKLGFDFNNLNWEEEFWKCRNLLYEVYYKRKYSYNEVSDYFGFSADRTPRNMLELFGFYKRRTIVEGVQLASSKGRIPLPPGVNGHNRQGWYTTFSGEKVFYRSSYELAAIKLLEGKNINFTLNDFQIVYKSSKDGNLHTGYPDFYLPDYEVLVEIKNEWNYDYTNLEDRFKSIQELNLDLIVITCKGSYRKEGNKWNFKIKNFKLLTSFISDPKKEKLIKDIFDIK